MFGDNVIVWVGEVIDWGVVFGPESARLVVKTALTGLRGCGCGLS